MLCGWYKNVFDGYALSCLEESELKLAKPLSFTIVLPNFKTELNIRYSLLRFSYLSSPSVNHCKEKPTNTFSV